MICSMVALSSVLALGCISVPAWNKLQTAAQPKAISKDKMHNLCECCEPWEDERHPGKASKSPDIPLADLVVEAACQDDAVLRVKCGHLRASHSYSSPQAGQHLVSPQHKTRQR